jgi:hypothetical protein
MRTGNNSLVTQVLFVVLLSFGFSGCQPDTPMPWQETPAPVETPLTSPVPGPILEPTLPADPSPTPTLVPLAVMVNGKGIPLADFTAEMERYLAAGLEADEKAQEHVLQLMVDEELLAQAAQAEGYSLSESEVQQRVESLAAEVGGLPVLQEWMAANFYTESTFKSAIQKGAQAAWMRDQIAAGVPEAVEQVRVRQILLPTETQASQILAQLQGGANFETLAARQDPVTGGDLGWFPRGYLVLPALESAAFALQAGETSGIVETELGFHILKVVERSEQRLAAEARYMLQAQAVENWLADSRNQSEIQVLLP